jgi:hypothetical protein
MLDGRTPTQEAPSVSPNPSSIYFNSHPGLQY